MERRGGRGEESCLYIKNPIASNSENEKGKFDKEPANTRCI